MPDPSLPPRSKLSQLDKRLVLMLLVGGAFYLFSNWISRQMDAAVARQDIAAAERHRQANPWAKD